MKHHTHVVCGCFCTAARDLRASQLVLVVKNLPANAGDIRDTSSIPASGRSPGGGHGNPLQYSCLENPMDRGAWRADIHSVAESNMTEATQRTHNGVEQVPETVRFTKPEIFTIWPLT